MTTPKIDRRTETHENQDVFGDTLEHVKAGCFTIGFRFAAIKSKETIANDSIFYTDKISAMEVPTRGKTSVRVVDADCVEEARLLKDRGFNPALLNMANGEVPGSGVFRGSNSQEASLLRRSNLCASLFQYDEGYATEVGLPPARDRYPLDARFGGIYSGGIVFFREGPEKGYALGGMMFDCGVVSVPALKNPYYDGRALEGEALWITLDKIRTIFRIALVNGHDSIVLSAFGCGIMKNSPDQMAHLFAQVLREREFKDKFAVVRFAIALRDTRRNDNYEAFAGVFNGNPEWDTGLMLSDRHGLPEYLTAEMLRDFKTTPVGSTRPRVGKIGNKMFIAKCGAWSEYSSDEHVHNESIADYFLAISNLAVPASREYVVDFGGREGRRIIRLSWFFNDLKPLEEVWRHADGELRARIREQVVKAYPIQSFIAGIDTFMNDNVRVAPNGELFFVDNGASFDFRARGGTKGWFWKRSDVHDPKSGYLSLFNHPDQRLLREILGRDTTAEELWKAAVGVSLARLVKSLPLDYRKPELLDYARQVEETALRYVNC